MPDLNTNVTNRLPSRISTTNTEIFSIGDFPAAIGGVITLSGNVSFSLKNSIITGDRFEFADNANIQFINESIVTQTFTYTGTGTLFSNASGAKLTRLYMNDFDIVCTNSASTVFNLKGNDDILNELFLDFMNLITVGNLGTIEEFALYTVGDTLAVDYIGALNLINNFSGRLGLILFPGSSLTGASVRVTGSATNFLTISESPLTIDSPQSAFFIEPIINATGSVIITTTRLTGTGNFYEPGTTDTFTATSDEGATNAILSVNTSGDAVFDKESALTNLQDDDIVVHTAFTDSGYDGTFTVTAKTANTYKAIKSDGTILQSTGSTATGTSTSSLTRFTSTAHLQLENQTLLITNSTDYNGGFAIRGTPLTNSFDLRVLFTTTQSGNWDTGSLTQSDNRLDVQNNVGTPDSMITGELHFINIASPLTVTVGGGDQGVALQLGATTFTSQNLERFSATTAGVATFNDLKERDIIVNFSALIEKLTGGGTDIGLGLLKNGSTISGFVYAHSVNTGIIQINGTRTISMTSDDTVELAVINFGNTDDIAISQADMVLSRAP